MAEEGGHCSSIENLDKSDEETNSSSDANGSKNESEIESVDKCAKTVKNTPLSVRPKDVKIQNRPKKYWTLTLRRPKRSDSLCNKDEKLPWTTKIKNKLPNMLRKAKTHGIPDPRPCVDDGSVVCTGYRRTEDHLLGPGVVFGSGSILRTSSSLPGIEKSCIRKLLNVQIPAFNPDDYPTEDIDVIRIRQRSKEMETGIEISSPADSIVHSKEEISAAADLCSQCSATGGNAYPNLQVTPDTSTSYTSEYGSVTPSGSFVPRTVHTQVDYIHCLVPDLQSITKCGFYWGVMDRYEAENLLLDKPEGTFLLRDSAQEEFLFSVSFRRYGRTLHARVEQWNHKFSFDCHDPGVFASHSVCGLLEHYKDPGSCLFFEPMLTRPLNRTQVFSLQNLSRSAICTNIGYDGINRLPLPGVLKETLRYYHYKQKVRVRRFEISNV